MGGSFGMASGEAFIAGANHSIENKTPFIFFSCSGGQRMQQSGYALQQMTRTTLAVSELKKNNIPFIVVLTNPTTGGVTASWAMLGDIIISEPAAMVAFAGARVIKDTVKEDLPGSFLNVLLKKEEAQAKKESINAITINKSLQSAS